MLPHAEGSEATREQRSNNRTKINAIRKKIEVILARRQMWSPDLPQRKRLRFSVMK